MAFTDSVIDHALARIPTTDGQRAAWKAAYNALHDAVIPLMTRTGQHTVTISGTPTSGNYTLGIGGRGTHKLVLAFDTDSATLQAAIRALGADFAAVTVAESGTGPNYTHTIDWVNLGNMTVEHLGNTLDQGAVVCKRAQLGGAVNEPPFVYFEQICLRDMRELAEHMADYPGAAS